MRECQARILNDYFPLWASGGGIVSKIATRYNASYSTIYPSMDWAATSRIAASLDLEYHAVRSGIKPPSYLVENVNADDVAGVLINMYWSDWYRLWHALELEYNPIQNYDMVEDGNDDSTSTDDTSKSQTIRGTNTRNQTINGSDRDSGVDGFTHQQDGTHSTQYGPRSTTQNGSVTKAGKENTKVTEDSDSTKTLASESTRVAETYPDGGMVETTTDTGTERVSEKGGTVRSVWGFDSQTPVNSEQTIAVGGSGQGDGTGDGSVAGDGHVTDTTYLERKNVKATTGSKNTVTDHDFLNDEHLVENRSSITELSFDGRTDTTANEMVEAQRTDVQTEDWGYTDATHYGKITTHENDISQNDTQDSTVTDKGTVNGTSNTTHHLTRRGNIGVTTSQQMLESEYELRKRHFFEQVFADIDKALTIPIYY